MSGRVAFIFPGQGMEAPRMGLDLAREHPPAMDLLLEASELAGVDLLRLLERGGPDLGRTEVLQPALSAVSLGALSWLREAGVKPVWVAGHSLGEVAAWAATGAVTVEDAVALAATRGRLMAREAARAPGGMLALMDPAPGDLGMALHLGEEHGAVAVAAHNAPGEWVLTGDRDALSAVSAVMKTRPVPAAGPWHSPAMAGAVADLRQALDRLRISEADVPMICNTTGEIAPPEQIPGLLVRQFTAPVQWARTMDTLVSQGVTDLVTVGPGKVLRGLARKNLGDGVRIHATETPAHLERTLKGLQP